MFETSVVRSHAQASRGRLSLITVSIIAHSAAILGAMAMSIASVEFPDSAPDEFAHAPVVAQIRIPPPLGDPHGTSRPQPAQPAPQRPAPQPVNQITAPSNTPDTIPTVDTPQSSTGTGDAAGPSTGIVPGPIGVPWGDPNSIGTDLDAPPATTTIAPVQERIYAAHEVTPPAGLYKPQPPYPAVLVRTRMQATVVVRCVIDKNGRVRDAQILVPALPPFNQSVLDTIAAWRFTPGSLNGVAVETYLDLTVNFAVR